LKSDLPLLAIAQAPTHEHMQQNLLGSCRCPTPTATPPLSLLSGGGRMGGKDAAEGSSH
jgi:hypothetical protein